MTESTESFPVGTRLLDDSTGDIYTSLGSGEFSIHRSGGELSHGSLDGSIELKVIWSPPLRQNPDFIRSSVELLEALLMSRCDEDKLTSALDGFRSSYGLDSGGELMELLEGGLSELRSELNSMGFHGAQASATEETKTVEESLSQLEEAPSVERNQSRESLQRVEVFYVREDSTAEQIKDFTEKDGSLMVLPPAQHSLAICHLLGHTEGRTHRVTSGDMLLREDFSLESASADSSVKWNLQGDELVTYLDDLTARAIPLIIHVPERG